VIYFLSRRSGHGGFTNGTAENFEFTDDIPPTGSGNILNTLTRGSLIASTTTRLHFAVEGQWRTQ
jgi:hypothetical protein